MGKIYVKTIVLVFVFAVLLAARLGLLIVQLPIPASILNFLLLLISVAVFINEKLTKGEKWLRIHYVLLGISILFISYVCFML